MSIWGGTVDELVASWWRPVVAVLAGVTICICTIAFADVRLAGMGMLATLAGGAGYLRTIDKKTATTAANPQPVSVGKTG